MCVVLGLGLGLGNTLLTQNMNKDEVSDRTRRAQRYHLENAPPKIRGAKLDGTNAEC